MKIRGFVFLVIFLVFYLVNESHAKTYAILVGTDGQVAKIDTDTDTIVGNLKFAKSSHVQDGQTSVVKDQANKNIYVVTGRLTPSIYVYDLKTLKFKKNLGIRAGNPDVGILVSPNGKQLFIRWFDPKERGWFFDLYDATNLTEIRNMGAFTWESITTFSPDGSKIFVYERVNKKIKIYETKTFTLVDAIDLNAVWRTNVFAQNIVDVEKEKFAIVENEKAQRTDPSKYTVFVYDLQSKTSSPRIATGIMGSTGLSPDGTKIFVSEEQPIGGANYVKYFKSMGRLHIYDVATGKKWGAVQFTVDKSSEIIGIHPNGSKAYMIGNIQGNRSLLVLDVVNLKVTKTLKISNNTLFMIFYNE